MVGLYSECAKPWNMRVEHDFKIFQMILDFMISRPVSLDPKGPVGAELH